MPRNDHIVEAKAAIILERDLNNYFYTGKAGRYAIESWGYDRPTVRLNFPDGEFEDMASLEDARMLILNAEIDYMERGNQG